MSDTPAAHTPCPPDPHPGCAVCSAPTGDDGRLCRTHTDQLAADLAAVPDLAAELDITRTRQARTTPGRHGARSSTRPLPWNEHAATIAGELNATVNAWALDTARLAEDDRDRLADHPHHDTAQVAAWLGRNLPTLRHHPDAGDAHAELCDAIHRARQAIDRPAEQVTFGPCGNPDRPDGPCTDYLYGPPGRPEVTCRGCGAVHDTAVRMQWMRDTARDMLGTITEIAGYLRLTGVKTSAAAIRGLVDRDRLHPHGVNARRHPVYRVSEVLDAITARYQHRRAS